MQEFKEQMVAMHQPLNKISIFHTDRGSEFNNECIDKIVEAFGIQRSLSKKGYTYDNAVDEVTYNISKAEFVFVNQFKTLKELSLTLDGYVCWYNNVRIHSAL
ncbi:MAG: IS3 family transposase [Clostridia bacterium]